MRYQIEFKVSGKTMSDVVAAATRRWQSVVDDKSAELPNESEIDAEYSLEAEELIARVFVRGKR